MGINKQTMPASAFDGDLQKQGSKSLKLSTKNLGFVAFAIIILQVADACLQWLVGRSTSQHDTFMYAMVVFIISKCIYTKYLNDAKVRADKTNEDEASEEAQTEEQPATRVVDTLKTRIRTFKSTKAFAPRAAKPETHGQKENWVPTWLKDSGPQRLNAKAKKFVPVGPSNTLDSEAPLFLPTVQQVEEYQLLKSECGGVDTGAVVYRSRHWLQEIRPDTKKSTPTQNKSKSPEIRKKKVPELVRAQKAPELVPAEKVPELVPAQKVRKGSPDLASKKKWQEKVNPKDIKWASAWSTFQTVYTL